MNHLLREFAPITDMAWAQIDDEATRTLKHFLTGRRLVDFHGGDGFQREKARAGRIEPVKDAPAGIEARIRVVQPIVEYRAEFWISRSELEIMDRGAPDADLGPVTDAARRLAVAEDEAIFLGNRAAQIVGIVEASPLPNIPISDDYAEYPAHVARAVSSLRTAGVSGPYAVALGPRPYTGVVETTEHGGYPVFQHLRSIAEGPVLWAPAVDGAVVMSTRGEDYELTVGEDVAIGYLDHDAEQVHLYLEETFTFQVLTPEAAVHLSYEL